MKRFLTMLLLITSVLFYSSHNITQHDFKQGVLNMSVFGDWLNSALGKSNQGQTQSNNLLGPGMQYVGPYSPEAYNAANIIQGGGTGTPYTLPIIQAGQDILNAQPTSGGTTGTATPDLSTYQTPVNNDINTLQGLYNSLYGGITKQVNDQSSQLQNQYNQQFDTANKAQQDALGRNNDIFTGRNAFNSSYRENAANDLNNTYNQDVNNMTTAEQNGLAGLGKYAQTSKAGVQADQNNINGIDLSQYTDVPSLQALHSQLGQHISSLQTQLAGLGTNSDYMNTLNSIAPIQSQAATQLSGKLANLANSSAAPEAKDALAQGYIKEAQLSDPNAKNYWTNYFNSLISKPNSVA